MESRTFPAILASLEPISVFITAAAQRVGFDDRASWQVQLAVDEAATNIIQHGYEQQVPGSIEIAWRVEQHIFTVTLRDFGRRFDPMAVPAPDLAAPLEDRQVGGLGIYLMQKLMDDVSFAFDERGGNLLTMTKRLSDDSPAVHTFTLSGRLDAVHTQGALATIEAAVGVGVRRILLNFSEVTFLSSTALRSLLLVRRELIAKGGELRLCALRPHVYEVFELTGFTQVFAIHATREEALAAFGREQA